MIKAPFFSKSNLNLKELFSSKKEYTAIAGAGVSMDAPSCLLSAKQIVKYLVDYCVAKEEVNKLLTLPGLRYELVIGGIKEFYDKNLNFMNFFDFFEMPNINHFFIAGLLISNLGDVITTNFDYLIELAVMEHFEEKDYPRIMPIITKPDFNLFVKKEQIKKIKEEKKIPICKIHGSKKNIVTGENTTHTLVTTMADLGRDREGAGIFSVEPYKLPLLNNLTEGRTLLVMGYSGSDDFDIGPTLRDLPNVNEIIWINHVMDDLPNEIEILEINNKVRKAELTEQMPQIDRVLGLLGKELKEKGSNIKIYRIDVNTTKFVDKLLWNLLIPNVEKPQLGGPDKSREELEQIIKGLIGDHVESDILRWQMAYYLYSNLFLDEDALHCAKIAIEQSEKEQNLPMKTRSMHQAGSALVRKYQFEDALKYFEAALEIAEKDFYDELYLAIGNTLKELGKQKEAIKYFRKGGKIAKENNDLLSLTKFTMATGSLYMSLGQYGLASPAFNEALGYLDKLGDLKLKADVLTNLADIKLSTRKYDEAHKLYEEILKLEIILGDPSSIANTYNNIAVNKICFAGFKLYDESTKEYYDSALDYCQKALEIAESLPNIKGLVYSTLGSIYFYIEDFEKSLSYYEQSLKIFQDLKDMKNLAETYKDLAEFYRQKREFDKAIYNHKLCLEYGGNIRNIFVKSRLYDSYAVTLGWAGNYSEAREYAIKSLNISEELSRADMDVELIQNYYLPKVNVIVQKMNIANTYYQESQWDKALEWYNQILPLKENVLSELDILVSYANIGNCYTNLKDYNRANEFQTIALKFADKSSYDSYKMAIRKDIAWNYMELKEFDKCMEWYQECLKIGENAIKGLNKTSKTYESDLMNRKSELASVYNQIAIMFDNQQLYDKALEYYKISAKKFEETNELTRLATIIQNIAYTYSNLKDYENSRKYYIDAAERYAKIGDSKNEMMCYNRIGLVYSYLIPNNKDLFEECVSYYKKAVEVAERINSVSEKSVYLFNLASVFKNNGFYEKAIDYYIESSNEAEIVGDYIGCGDSNYYIAVCYGKLNNELKDIDYLKKSIDYYQKVRDEDVKNPILIALTDIGNLYSGLKDPEESLKYFRQALDIAQEMNNTIEICKTYNRMGTSYSNNKMYEEAFKWYERAYQVAIELNDYDLKINCLRNIAVNYEDAKEWNKAVEFYKKSLEMRNKDNDIEGIEKDLVDIGYGLRELKKYEESMDIFKQQVEISEKIPNSAKLRNGLRWIGKLFLDQNKREDAIAYYLKAADYDHRIGNYEDESDDLADVAYTYTELNNMDESSKYYDKYIEVRETYGYKDYKKYKDRLHEYAMQYFKRSEWEKSLKIFEKKYEIVSKFGNAEEKMNALFDVGNLARRVKDYEKSIRIHTESLKYAKELNNAESTYDILWEMGLTYMESEDWASALNVNQEVFEIADKKKSDNGKFISSERVGICYYNLKDLEKSLNYLDLSVVLGDSILQNTARSYSYIAKIEEDTRFYEEAKYYYNIALEKENTQGDKKNSQTYADTLDKIAKKIENLSQKTKKIKPEHQFKTEIINLIESGKKALNNKEINVATYLFGRAFRYANRIQDLNYIAESCQNIGNAYYEYRFFLSASRFYNQSVETYLKNAQKNEALKSMMLYADAICKTDENSKWFKSYEDAQKLAEEIQDNETLIIILNILGNLYTNVNKDHVKAAEYYSNAREKALKHNSMDNYYQAVLNLTAMYEKLGRYNDSIAEYEKTKEIFKQRKMYSNYGTVCNNIAIVYMDFLNDLESALKEFLEGYNLVKDIETNPNKMMINLKNIGLTYTRMKKYESSTEYYMKLLDLVKEKGTKKQLAESYNYVGVSYANANKSDLVVEYYDKALEIAKELKEEQLQADILTNKAIESLKKKNYEESLMYYKQTADLYQKLEKWAELEQSFAYIGSNAFNLRNYEDSINFYWKAADAAKRVNNWNRVASDYGNIANSFWQLNNEKKAFEFFEEAANIYDKIGDYNRAGNMIYQITYIYERMKEHQKAADYNKKEYEYYEKTNNIEMKYWSSSRLAHNLWRANNFKDSAEWFSIYAERARDFNKPKDILYGLLSSADCYYKIGNHEKAIEVLMRTLEFESINEYSTTIWQATIDLADNHLLLGNIDKATEFCSKAMVLAEQNKKLEEKAEVLVMFSKICEIKQEIDKCIEYRDQAFEILKDYKYYKYKMREYENYAKFYEKIGNPKRALKYHNLSEIYKTKSSEEDEENYLSDWYRKDEEKETVFSYLSEDCVFLFGSDLSKLKPTYLESPKEITKSLLEFFAKTEDIDSIIENRRLSYNTIISLIKEIFDPELRCLDSIKEINTYNITHLFAANLIKKDYPVLVTNNDNLIEISYNESESLQPIITKEDFANFTKSINKKINSKQSSKKVGSKLKKHPIIKLNGSITNPITHESTSESMNIITRPFLSFEHPNDKYFIKPYKKPLVNDTINGKTLIIIGFTESFEFNLYQIIQELPPIKKIIWFVNSSNATEVRYVHHFHDEKYWKDKSSLFPLFAKMQEYYKCDIFKIYTDVLSIIKDKLWTKLLPNVQFPEIANTNTIGDKSNDFNKYFKDKLISVYKELPESKKYLFTLRLYFELQDIENLRNSSNSALEFAEKTGDLCFKADTLTILAKGLEQINEFGDALHYYNEAIGLYEKTQNWIKRVELETYLGVVYLRIGDLDLALNRLEDAFIIAEENDLQEKYTEIYMYMGFVTFLNGYHSEGVSLLNKAMDNAHKYKQTQLKANINEYLSECYKQMKKFTEQSSYIQDAIKFYQQLTELLDVCNNYNELGNCYLNLKKHGDAIQSYQNALDLYRKMNISEEIVNTLLFLSLVYNDLKDFENAFKILKEAKDVADFTRNDLLIADVNNHLGLVNFTKEDYTESYKYTKLAFYTYEKRKEQVKLEEMRKRLITIQENIKK